MHWADIMSLAGLYSLVGVNCIVLDAHSDDLDKEMEMKRVYRRCSSSADVMYMYANCRGADVDQ